MEEELGNNFSDLEEIIKEEREFYLKKTKEFVIVLYRMP